MRSIQRSDARCSVGRCIRQRLRKRLVARAPRRSRSRRAPAPAGTGFVALYAPPVDVVPYPNDLYNPTGTRLAVPVKITSPLAQRVEHARRLLDVRRDQRAVQRTARSGFADPVEPAVDGAERGVDHRAERDGGHAARAGRCTTRVRVSTAAGSGNSVLEIVPLRPLARARATRSS